MMYDGYKYHGNWNAYSPALPEYPTAEYLGNTKGLILNVTKGGHWYVMYEGPDIQTAKRKETYIKCTHMVRTESMR